MLNISKIPSKHYNNTMKLPIFKHRNITKKYFPKSFQWWDIIVVSRLQQCAQFLVTYLAKNSKAPPLRATFHCPEMPKC